MHFKRIGQVPLGSPSWPITTALFIRIAEILQVYNLFSQNIHEDIIETYFGKPQIVWKAYT